MAHLSKFGLGNFRVFQELEQLELAPITVLTGTNNSGKSSLIKGLLLFRDNVIKNDHGGNESLIDKEKLDFTNGEHKTGDFQRSKNIYSNKKEITFSLPFYFDQIDDNMSLQLSYILDSQNQLKNGQLSHIHVYMSNGKLLIELKPTMDKRWDIWFDLVFLRKQFHRLLKKKVIDNESKNKLRTKQYQLLDEKDWVEEELLKEEEYVNILKSLDEDYHKKRIQLASKKISFVPGYTTNDINKIATNSEYKNRPITSIEAKLPLYWKSYFYLKDFRRLYFQIISENDYKTFFEENEYFQENFQKFHKANKKRYSEFFEEKYLDYLDKIFAELIASGYNFKNQNEFLTQLKENELWVLSNEIAEKVTYLLSHSELENIINGIENSLWNNLTGKNSLIINESFYEIPEKIYKKSLLYRFLSVYNSYLEKYPEFKKLSDFFKSNLNKYNLNLCGNDKHLTQLFFKEFLYNGFKNSFTKSLRALRKVEFIEAVRANTQRLYTYSPQGTGFNQLLLEFQSLGLEKSEEEMNFIKKWTNEFGLGNEIQIKPVGDGIGSFVFVDNVPLADCGYGVTQLVPILIKITAIAHKNFNKKSLDYGPGYYWRSNPSILIVEEPETNLHPKLQSKLADMFVDAAGTFNIQFIIETHSEYLIRKLQYLTANKEHEYNIKPEDTAIYYINDPKTLKKGEKQVRRINIREDGILDGNFGPGFFDEASNLIIDILKISGSN